MAVCRRHTSSSQRKGKNDVDDGIDGHVANHTAQALETFQLTVSQNGRRGDLPSQLEVHDRVEAHRTEFGQENPDVMSPETNCLILFIDPTPGA